MTREEKKKKAAAIGAATYIAIMQCRSKQEKDSRWRVAGITRLMSGRNATHQYGRYQ